VSSEPFSRSQMFVSKAGAYPTEAPFRYSTLGLAPCPGWNDFPGTNTPTYFELLYNTAVKTFIRLGRGNKCRTRVEVITMLLK
jgi:hypothetical protein